MDVIRHQTKAMNAVIILFNPLPYETQETEIIRDLEEYLLACVPPYQNVVKRS